MTDKREAIRWLVFTRLMERYNSDFLGDETIMKRIEEAVDKAAKELEVKEEVVIEVPFIAAGAEGSPQGPMHFREVIRREDLTPLLDEEPWIEEHEAEVFEDISAGPPPPLGPEPSYAGFFFLLVFLGFAIASLLIFLM